MGWIEKAETVEPTEETCVFCETKFTSNGALWNHVLHDHRPTKDEKGKDVDDDYQQHELIQNSFSCGVCGKHMFDKFCIRICFFISYNIFCLVLLKSYVQCK